MNLLNETIEAVIESGHTIDQIIFIGSEKTGHKCNWDEYSTLADREYDSGFGAAQVAQDLIVVFSDGTKLWRGEYDGSEWWQFSSPFTMPKEILAITGLFAPREKVGWCHLSECGLPNAVGHTPPSGGPL